MQNTTKPEGMQIEVETNLQNAQTTVQHLVKRAVAGLPQMIDERSGLFCFKVKRNTQAGLVQEGLSPRYTAMTLMGLRRLEKSGTRSPIETNAIFEGMMKNLDWIENVGDLGLVFWLTAQLAPRRLDDLEQRLQLKSALARFQDKRNGVTMHLAWLLTGICYSAQATGNTTRLKEVAYETYKLLIQNQGKDGYFRHMAANGTLKANVRGWMGSFADQVYPIYAMTQFFKTFSDESALDRARQTAHAICQAQGPLGQWWWHYDARNGKVFEQYPVFSVHQHGMAPMTLLPLGKAAGIDFQPWINKGLEWIDQHNELSVNMEDDGTNVIWRCIRQSRVRRVSEALFGAPGNSQPAGLSVLHECRPYELGWLLYGLIELLPQTHPST
jgi:hypothetical protein